MKILLYQGTGIISKAIRWQTRSKYSHVAVQLGDNGGPVIEAWHTGGEKPWHGAVREIPNAFHDHAPDTKIDVCSVNEVYSPLLVEEFLRSHIGDKYCFSDIARFITRRETQTNDRWFCSELVLAAFDFSGLPLLRGRPSKMAPGHVAMSPYLVLEKTIYGD